MICFYHSADLDGHCSGAIVKHAYKDKDCELYGINYGEEFPWDKIKDQEVIMVDFSLQPFSEMIKLKNQSKFLIWIDHHESAIKDSKNCEIDGVRDVKKAACELTWEYFNKYKEMPRIVKLLGRYDVWDHEYNDDILPLQYGIKTIDTDPKECERWEYWLDGYFPEFFLEKGNNVLEYLKKDEEKYAKACAFETDLEGYNCIAINRLFTNSKMFDSVWDEKLHDIMITFGWKNNSWTVSLYTTKEDIDVSVIAKKMGGGGHKQAAGFQCEELPFELK